MHPGTAAPTALLERRRLIEASAGARVRLLRGEAGAGKTTLASQLVRAEREGTLIWVAIDPACTTSTSFWHRAITSAAGALRERRSILLSYLAGDVPLSQVPALVVAELQQRAGDLLSVVIDDMHLLDEQTQGQIAWVLERAPTIRFTATTRAPTVLEDAAIAARLGTRTISSGALAFDASELDALARIVAPGRAVAPGESAAIMEYTRGNALATRIALAIAQQLGERRDPAALRAALHEETADGGALRPLFPRFADAEDREAALRLSLVPAADVRLVAEVTGRADAAELLRRYQVDGIGQVQRARHWRFAFHPLVAELLSERAKAELPPAELRRVWRVGARHLREWGDPVEVMRLMLAAGADEEVWPYYAQHFSELSVTRLDEVAALFDGLDPPAEQRDATLALIQAIAAWERGFGPSLRSMQLASVAMNRIVARPVPERTGDRFLHELAVMAVGRTSGRGADAARGAVRLLSTARRLPADERRRIGAAFEVGVVQALVVEATMGHDEAVVADAQLVMDDTCDARRRHALSLAAFAQARRGDMVAARAALAQLGDTSRPEWARSIRAAGWRIAAATSLVEQARADEAIELLRSTQGADTAEFWPAVLWARALALLASDDPGAALDEVAHAIEARSGTPTGPALLGDLAALHADLAIAAGELERAGSVLAQAPEGAAVALSEVRLALARRHPDSALERLRALEREGALSPRRDVERLLLAAVARLRMGRSNAGALGRRAARMLHAHDLRTPLLFVPAHERELLLEGALGADLVRSMNAPFPVPAERSPLTPRELIVWHALHRGGSLEQVAAELFVSVNTVKSQTSSVYRKLGATTRAEAIARGLALGLDEQDA